MTRLLESCEFRVAVIRPHVQRLELDYILSRGAVLSPGLTSVARRVTSMIGARRLQVPYWLGQTFVIARRTNALALALLAGSRELAEILMLL